MVRILLADDHSIVRRGLRQLLEEQQGWEIVGEAANGRQAVEMAKKLMPHVAIFDLQMSELNGLEATRQLRHALPSTEVLIYTMHDSEQLIREVLATGARGYLLKSDAPRHIVDAVEALAQHKPFFNWKVSETMLDGFLRGEARLCERSISDPLTGREREIVQLLVKS